MKLSFFVPWLLLLCLLAAQVVWNSNLISGWKFVRGMKTKDDSMMMKALDQMEATNDQSLVVILELAEHRLDLANRQRMHVLDSVGKLVASHPADPRPLILRGQILRSSGQLREAVDDIRAAKEMIKSGSFKSDGFVPSVDAITKMLNDYESVAGLRP